MTDGVCGFGWAPGCAKVVETAMVAMKVKAARKRFLFMIDTPKGSKPKMRRRVPLPHLRILAEKLLRIENYFGGVTAAVAGFLLLNSMMKALVISRDSDALTMP